MFLFLVLLHLFTSSLVLVTKNVLTKSCPIPTASCQCLEPIQYSGILLPPRSSTNCYSCTILSRLGLQTLPDRRHNNPLLTMQSYRILCSVLLGTADNVIWPVLSFQVDAHWGEVKGIKSYLQCIEGAKIWQKQLSPSWMGYPPESSKPVISQHSVGCSGSVCMFVCLYV